MLRPRGRKNVISLMRLFERWEKGKKRLRGALQTDPKKETTFYEGEGDYKILRKMAHNKKFNSDGRGLFSKNQPDAVKKRVESKSWWGGDGNKAIFRSQFFDKGVG